MFYCNACATKREWPETGFKSTGTCEVCGKKNQLCNDVPSKYLPPPRKETRK